MYNLGGAPRPPGESIIYLLCFLSCFENIFKMLTAFWEMQNIILNILMKFIFINNLIQFAFSRLIINFVGFSTSSVSFYIYIYNYALIFCCSLQFWQSLQSLQFWHLHPEVDFLEYRRNPTTIIITINIKNFVSIYY